MSGLGGVASGPGGPDALEALRSGRIQGRAARLEAATRLLEGTFYQEVFKAMRATVPDGGALPAGRGQEMFQSLLDQTVADAAAAGSDRGLGSALYRYFVSRMPGLVDGPGNAASPGAASGGPATRGAGGS